MKKITFFAALFLLLGSGACTTDENSDDNNSPEANPIVGKWVLEAYDYNGEEQVPEECETQFSLEFLSTGTVMNTKFYSVPDSEECVPYTYNEEWEYTGNNTYTFTEEDDESYSVQIIFSNNDDIFTVTDEDEHGAYRAVYKRV